MKKTILALMLSLSLAACASLPSTANPQQLPQQQTQPSQVSFNTQVAAAYESLAQLRNTTALALQMGKITPQAAQTVQTMADEAHAMLDTARLNPLTTGPATLQQAANMLNQMAALLGTKQ